MTKSSVTPVFMLQVVINKIKKVKTTMGNHRIYCKMYNDVIKIAIEIHLSVAPLCSCCENDSQSLSNF